MKFRKDINGLRAIAVISVILFHYNESWLPGGFVGVDIFFVISGYLMTSIIFSGLDRGDFSILRFYLARGKRIIPALALVCLGSLFFGIFFLSPGDLSALSKHALSSLAFISNIIYAGEAGYFDAASNEKWLLHTWSLSVEWQFYLIYPIVLSVAARFLDLAQVKKLVVGGCFIGFAYCLFVTHSNPTNAFFLLPARAWEMLVGGAAFLYPFRGGVIGRKAALLVGWAAIIASCLMISESAAWPGYLALVPVIGTYLVIQADFNNPIVTNNRLVQVVGTYSYSLYLWHWPIIVAVAYLQLESDAMLMLSMLTVLILLSVLSYRLLEAKRLATDKVAATAMVAALSAVVVIYTSGLSFRVAPEFKLSHKEYHQQYYGGSGYGANQVIRFGKEDPGLDVFFAGDSFGLQYAAALHEIGREKGLSFSGLFDHGCLIVPNYTNLMNGKEDPACSGEYKVLLGELADKPKVPLVLAFSWNGYMDRLARRGGEEVYHFDGNDSYFEMLRAELSQLFAEAGEERQYILVGVPQPAVSFAYRCLASSGLIGSALFEECVTEEPLRKLDVNTALSRIAESYSNVKFVDPNDVLCASLSCMVVFNGQPIHSDRFHLSVYGAKIVAPFVMNHVDGLDVQLARVNTSNVQSHIDALASDSGK